MLRVYCLWGRALKQSECVREREGDIKKQEKHFITKVSYFPSDALTAHRAEREKRRRYKFILEQGAALELLGAYLFIALERPSAA